MTRRLIDAITALQAKQIAGIRVVRVRLDGLQAVATINQTGRGLTYPGEDVTAWVDTDDVPAGVSAAMWSAWPDIVVAIDATTSIEDQLHEVLFSGIVGPGYVERLNQAGDVPPRWRLICDGASHSDEEN